MGWLSTPEGRAAIWYMEKRMRGVSGAAILKAAEGIRHDRDKMKEAVDKYTAYERAISLSLAELERLNGE